MLRKIMTGGQKMEEFQLPEGMKKTKQRMDVYSILMNASEPLTAIDIYERISKRDGGCGYAVSTIYRVLAAFEEKGYVEKTTMMGEDMAVYEWKNGTEHKHYAICLSCHTKVPLKKCPFQRMMKLDKTQEDDFEITGHKIELYGYCKKCQAKEKSELGEINA